MSLRNLLGGSLLILALTAGAHAQEQPQQQTAATTSGEVRPSEARVPLAQAATAFDVAGREALAGRLRTQAIVGTPDAPVRNTRIVIENRSPVFFTYATGWATFYAEDGVRCGEGLWKLEALAPAEQAEVDTPGLRLTCTPATWRVVALNLLTRTADIAKPNQPAPPAAEPAALSSSPAPPSSPAAPAVNGQRLEININGRTLPLQLNNPVEIVVGQERVQIVVRPAP